MTEEFKNAIELIKQLDERFEGTQSLIVGGAVRDHLLNKEVVDVDIATNVSFDLIAQEFTLRDITKNTVNPQPVSVIVFNGFSYEIASFRADSAGVQGRSNNVATIVSSFEEDAARRDITINAIGLDSNGNLVDPQNGRRDLEEGIIRAVGIPAFRFREDATRILRVFRFAARFSFKIDETTMSTARHNKWRLNDRAQISPEAIAKEFFKAAANGPTLARFVTLLSDAGILEDHLPEFTALEGFNHDPEHHPEGGGTVIGHIIECLNASDSNDAVVNLAILFHDLGKAVTCGVKDNGHSNYHGHEGAGVPIVEGIFARLRFNDLTSADKEAILFAVGRHMLVHNLNELATKTLVKIVHHDGWNVLKEVSRADEASRGVDRFDAEAFNHRVSSAEARVANIAANRDDLRLKVKAFVDGNKVQEWFPEVKNNVKLLSPVLAACAEFILEQLDNNITPTEDNIRNCIAGVLNEQN